MVFHEKKNQSVLLKTITKVFFLETIIMSDYLTLYYNLFAYHLPSKVKVKSLSHVRLFATLWTVAYQATPSVHGILQARVQEWVAISFSRGIFPTQRSNLVLPHCRQMLLPSEPPGKS